MNDVSLLLYKLKHPPVMSMALNRDHLYLLMAELMQQAAEEIEALNTNVGTALHGLDLIASYMDKEWCTPDGEAPLDVKSLCAIATLTANQVRATSWGVK